MLKPSTAPTGSVGPRDSVHCCVPGAWYRADTWRMNEAMNKEKASEAILVSAILRMLLHEPLRLPTGYYAQPETAPDSWQVWQLLAGASPRQDGHAGGLEPTSQALIVYCSPNAGGRIRARPHH